MFTAFEKSPSPVAQSSSVTVVSFSPDARFLTTATSDGWLRVWEVGVEKCVLLCSASGNTTALAISWMNSSGYTFVYGTESGNVATCTFSPSVETLEIYGFFAHHAPVNCIAASGSFVASSAGGELRIWEWRKNGPWHSTADLLRSPLAAQDFQQESLVTAIFWTPGVNGGDINDGAEAPLLIATYLHQGVYIYDSKSWSCVQSFSLKGTAASASISKDYKLLSVLNLAAGFEIYSLQSGMLLRVLNNSGGKRASASRFIENDAYLVCGGEQGEAYVWDFRKGQRVQTFSHYAHDKVLLVDAATSSGRSFVITGVSDELNPYAVLWYKGQPALILGHG
ncbi:WD40-repeat-containing domain protein [Trametes gibbosa]|nr:WD40-repeat-containing domain protein [Trametes gibbosa]